ncbi:vWA domain-containing protein [Nocardia bovistercoris]|uniref:VWA domain-containing protein n=1 Tax=Nocardia bovistercoris TaxID=2785916 RepID=A0A931IBB3_9NOCA|nr:VWA domain-containing protein [Nocardia bovistercoris]MBH0777315.1 VWA domain-containing protein [Nocardia bovistercoris]
MVDALVKGQNGAVTVAQVVVSVRVDAGADVSALLVTESGKVRSDADFVFFNQPTAPGVELRAGLLAVSLDAVDAQVTQLRVVITLDEDGATFGRYAAPIATVADRAGNALYEYRIDGLDSESVVIALELYRRGPEWKVRAVGQGYAGGFAALVTDHGVSVDEDESAAAERLPAATAWSATTPAELTSADRPTTAGHGSTGSASVEPDVRTVPGEAALSLEKRTTLDLRKREVARVLTDRSANGVRARVVLVVDKTGSMQNQYRKQVVHRVVERVIPIATQLDDDGTLEAYLYARSFLKLPDIEVAHGERWARTFLHLTGVHEGFDYDGIGARNDELPIMRDIIDGLAAVTGPTLVLFFTDGGFAKKREIAELMREASRLPAFWQFVGLGRANYGVLRTLDELDGRLVDNAGFFALDDIDRVADAELYDRLLGEFPDWLRAARAAGITA